MSQNISFQPNFHTRQHPLSVSHRSYNSNDFQIIIHINTHKYHIPNTKIGSVSINLYFKIVLSNTISSFTTLQTTQQQRNEVNGGDEHSEFYLDGVTAVVKMSLSILLIHTKQQQKTA